MLISRSRASAAVVVLAASILAPSTATATADAGVQRTPQRQVAAADAYLEALSDRTKAYDVPFAKNVVRFENGLQTGFNAAQMHRDLDLHLQYSVMTAPIVHRRTVGVGGNPDILHYSFTVPVVIAGQHIVGAPTEETFRIPASSCLIERIDASITVAPV